MRLILTRHGRTTYADENRMACSVDVPLSKRGIEELCARKLAYSYPVSDHYFTSGMKRANETFSILYENKKLEAYLPAFKEHDMGLLEAEVMAFGDPKYRKWVEDVCLYGEESYSHFQDRILNAIEQLSQRYGHESVTVVCHAGVIRAAYLGLSHRPASDYGKLYPANGNAYIFEIEDMELVSLKSLDGKPLWEKRST